MTALITGQDGSYLAELLLEKGYGVHGFVRRASSFNTDRIDDIYRDLHAPDVQLRLHYGDLTDGSQWARLIRTVWPYEVYDLTAQSHVAVSFQQPEYAWDVEGWCASSRRSARPRWDTRLDQACTSEMVGDPPPPESQDTPLRPWSPYAAAKLYGYWLKREGYRLYAANGILFSQEDERRGETFVTGKVAPTVARIVVGFDDVLYSGNFARYATGTRDYVRAMWLADAGARQSTTSSAQGTPMVRKFLPGRVRSRGTGSARVCARRADYYRPTETEHLQADPSRACEVVGGGESLVPGAGVRHRRAGPATPGWAGSGARP